MKSLELTSTLRVVANSHLCKARLFDEEISPQMQQFKIFIPIFILYEEIKLKKSFLKKIVKLSQADRLLLTTKFFGFILLGHVCYANE